MRDKQMLSAREEIEIGVMVASELSDLVQEGEVNNDFIRFILREVTQEIGIGHTDSHLSSLTAGRIRRIVDRSRDDS